jgi:hypothetical protein
MLLNVRSLGASLAFLLLTANTVGASPGRRLALVVGANRGDGSDEPLRFAEADATRMARVLRELGGFQKDDIVELRTPDAPSVEKAMADLSSRAADEARAGRAPLILFYYSGHADADALHLAGTRVALSSLKKWIADSPAAVRLVVLDSCKSGALTRVKGAHAAPAIEVRLSDDLNTRGEAVLTSSTSDEMARESDGLRGSFFTHHLVTGLRGAADKSKDGRVTLAEAYDYAYAHTVSEAAGGQHPTFKYDLAGRGEVVLTSLGEAGAWLDFPSGTDGLYLILGEDGLVVGDVEVGKTPLKVAIAPGRYEVRKRTMQGDLGVRVAIGSGEERWVHDEELQPVPSLWQGPPKGEEGYLLPPPVVAAPAPPMSLLDENLDGARWDRTRRQGITWLIAGITNLIPAMAFQSGIYAANNVNDTAFLAPLSAFGIVASSALVAWGGYLLHEASDDRPLANPAPMEAMLARARSRGLRRRSTGARMMGYGFGIMGLGIGLGATGAGISGGGTNHDNGALAMMVLGFLPATIALGCGFTGIGLWRDGAHRIEEAEAGSLEADLPRVSFAPFATANGGGLSATGSF